MFDPAVYDEPVGGPWAAVCGVPGPYAIRRPTRLNIARLEVLTCTRPAGHPDSHQYATFELGVLASWAPSGAPIFPRPITARSDDGPAHPV